MLQGKNSMMIILLIVIVIVLLTVVDLAPLVEKFERINQSFMVRWARYSDAFSVVKDFPFFGTGLGNFLPVFPHYQSSILRRPDAYLHNDQVQLLLEAGILGTFFYCLFFISVFKNILIRVHKRHDPFIIAIVSGGLYGIFTLFIHSFFEILFPIPAISYLFWFLSALLYKSLYIHSRESS